MLLVELLFAYLIQAYTGTGAGASKYLPKSMTICDTLG